MEIKECIEVIYRICDLQLNDNACKLDILGSVGHNAVLVGKFITVNSHIKEAEEA